jgi:hypothetical protein
MYMSSEGTANNPQVLVVQTSGVGGRRGGGGGNKNSSVPDYNYSATVGGSDSQQTTIYSVPMEVDPTAQNNHYNLTIPKARALRVNATTTAATATATSDAAALPQKNNVYDKWGTGLPEASPTVVMASVYGDDLYTHGETSAGVGAAGSAAASTTYYGAGGGVGGGRASTYQPAVAEYYSSYGAPPPPPSP